MLVTFTSYSSLQVQIVLELVCAEAGVDTQQYRAVMHDMGTWWKVVGEMLHAELVGRRG